MAKRAGGTRNRGTRARKPVAKPARRSNPVKAPRVYGALRRKGYSEAKAGAISNAVHNGTVKRGGRRKR